MKYIYPAVRILLNGGVVVFPTETVYGIGASIYCEEGMRKIFKIKGRPSNNPLIVHIYKLEQLADLVSETPSILYSLCERFFPGPLTLICKKNTFISSIVSGGLDTIAIRMPSHPISCALLKYLDHPIAAPSANRSGRPSPTCYEDALKEMPDQYIIDGGMCDYGIESTVVSLVGHPTILRSGCITISQLQTIIPDIQILQTHVLNQSALSPGLMHQHYKPNCKVVLIEPDQWDKVPNYGHVGRLGIISFTRPVLHFKHVVLNRFFKYDIKQYVRFLYRLFFQAESQQVDILFVESVPKEDIGFALMDRILRASKE